MVIGGDGHGQGHVTTQSPPLASSREKRGGAGVGPSFIQYAEQKMTTTLIRGGTVVNADLSERADVLIKDGKIIAVGLGLSGDTVIDAGGCYIMPGGIDPHTHMDMPFMGTTTADDSFHLAVTQWLPMIHDEMEIVVKTYGINTFKHFMAYKGALMVNDDELYNSFKRCAQLGALPLVHAENGDVVARKPNAPVHQANAIWKGLTQPKGVKRIEVTP